MKPRILVISHDRTRGETLAMILSQTGFEARTVYSGETAIDEARGFKPDLLISDIIMPDRNGIDAVIGIRQILSSIRVLLMFSGNGADFLEQAYARGDDFEIMNMPIHPQDLLSWLRGRSDPSSCGAANGRRG